MTVMPLPIERTRLYRRDRGNVQLAEAIFGGFFLAMDRAGFRQMAMRAINA